MSTNLIILPNKHLQQPAPCGSSVGETEEKQDLHGCAETLIRLSINASVYSLMPLLIQQMFIERLLRASAWAGRLDAAVKAESRPRWRSQPDGGTCGPVDSYHDSNWSRLQREDVPGYARAQYRLDMGGGGGSRKVSLDATRLGRGGRRCCGVPWEAERAEGAAKAEAVRLE